MKKLEYIKLADMEVYKDARTLSVIAWEIYTSLPLEMKGSIGNQFLNSTDSIGANIAEGYGRFYYLDKSRFYYYARGSFFEANSHWLELFLERNLIEESQFVNYRLTADTLSYKLNNLIKRPKEQIVPYINQNKIRFYFSY